MKKLLSTGKAEQGVVLIITLFVLVVMTLASVTVIRTMDTSALSVASHSFRSTGNAMGTDLVEAAVQSLIDISNGASTVSQLNQDQSISLITSLSGGAEGQYHARIFDTESKEGIPEALQGRPQWKGVQDANTGNMAYVLIERMCNAAGPANRNRCVVGYLGDGFSTTQNDSMANDKFGFTGDRSIKILYRVTVRVEGPNNTVSFTQGVVNLAGSKI